MTHSLEELVAQRKELAQKARPLFAQVKAGGLSNAGASEALALADQITSLTQQIDQKKAAQEMLDSIQAPAAPEAKSPALKAGFLDRSPAGVRSAATKVAESIGRKALVPSSLEPIATPLVESPVMLPGQTAFTLSQLIPRRTLSSPSYRYLRQKTRTHNADVVAIGDTKPTSVYEFEEVDGKLFIVAHLSQPFHSYWPVDFPEAITALSSEMLNGLFDKEEDLILNGAGTTEPLGLLNTPGIQTQTFDSDLLTTTRAAITKLESIGANPGAFVFSPETWESIELARNEAGQLEFASGPVDRAAKRLWGIPVATSTRVESEGLLLDLSAATIVTDGSVKLEATNNYADDFAKNQIRMRAETRVDVEVTQPTGVVEIHTTAGS